MGSNERLDIPLRESNQPAAYFPEEERGWHGYIEWEKYTEKQAKAEKILAQYSLPGVRYNIKIHCTAALTESLHPATGVSNGTIAQH